MNLAREKIEKRLAIKRVELAAVPAEVTKILEVKYGSDCRLGISRDWTLFNYQETRNQLEEKLSAGIRQSILILEELLECYATD